MAERRLLQREEQEEGPGWSASRSAASWEELPAPWAWETPAENLLVAGIGLNLVSSPAALMRAARRSGRTPLFCNKIQCLAAPLRDCGCDL